MDYASPDTPTVVQESEDIWAVRLDGGLRVDTYFGFGRAVQKIPFDARRVGGSYGVIGTFTAGGHRWARIRRWRDDV